jgi:hypothetical protein
MIRLISLLLLAGIALTSCAFRQNTPAKATFIFEVLCEEEDTAPSKTIIAMEDNVTDFAIKTARTTVGAALLELNIIEGDEDEEHGFVIKVVDNLGVSEGARWLVYINDDESEEDIMTIEINLDYIYSIVYSSN